MLKMRKKDKVMVMGGKDKGKVGEIIKIFPEKMRVLVSQVNIVPTIFPCSPREI